MWEAERNRSGAWLVPQGVTMNSEWLEATPAQRLARLEEMIVPAH